MAILLSGGAGRVHATSGRRPTTASGWTAAGWTKRTAAATNANLLYIQGSGGVTGYLRTNGAGTHVVWGTQAGEQAGNILDITDGAWFFWCVVCSSTAASGVTIYLRKITATSFTTAARTVGNYAPTDWAYGAATWGGEGFTGAFDNLLCWNKALSAAEVESQWLVRVPVAPGNLWHWVPTLRADSTTEAIVNIAGTVGGMTSAATIALTDGAPVPWGASTIQTSGGAPIPAVLTQFGFRFFNNDGIATP